MEGHPPERCGPRVGGTEDSRELGVMLRGGEKAEKVRQEGKLTLVRVGLWVM